MTLVKYLRMISLLLLFVLALAACGGDGDGSAADEADDTATEAADDAGAGAETESPTGAATGDAAEGESPHLEQAMEEGEVIWYTGVGLDIAERVADEFEQTYPGISVTIFRETANAIYQRFTSELDSGAPTADVFDTSVLSMQEELKERGVLAQYTPAGEENVIENYRGIDPDGYYHTARLSHIVLAYNTDLVEEADAPTTWEDLLDDQWAGQIGTGHPGASGAVGVWALQMYNQYGVEFFEQLAAQDVLVGQSIRDTIPWVATGERAVVVTLDGEIGSNVEAGDPIQLVYPEDGAVGLISPVAVTDVGEHPAAARLFMDWLFTERVSEIYAEEGFGPIIEGVAPPDFAPAEFTSVSPTLEEMNTTLDTVVEEWRRLFGV